MNMKLKLDKKDLSRFRDRLEEMRKKMSSHLKDSAEDVKSGEKTNGYSQHQADSGTDNFAQTVSLEITSKDVNTLKQVERALEKLEEGTFGICDVSGDAIPLARLEAVPQATMTVQSQEKLEKGLL